MIKRPNFYLLCVVKESSWKYPLVVPVPLFLMDELLDLTGYVLRFMRHKKMRIPTEFNGVKVDDVIKVLRGSWREIRRAGSFTLVEVNDADGTKVSVKLI